MNNILGDNNKQNGVFNKMNCKIFSGNLERFHNTVCIGLVPNIY